MTDGPDAPTPHAEDAPGSAQAAEPLTLAQLRALPDAEVVLRFDAALAGRGWVVGPDDYANELARREAQRLSATLARLTRVITVLAAVVVLLAVFALVLSVVALRGG